MNGNIRPASLKASLKLKDKLFKVLNKVMTGCGRQ